MSAYACEGNQLSLQCGPDELIQLVRANYGRFSISLCNDGGRLDMAVNCMSFRSFLIMQDRSVQSTFNHNQPYFIDTAVNQPHDHA